MESEHEPNTNADPGDVSDAVEPRGLKVGVDYARVEKLIENRAAAEAAATNTAKIVEWMRTLLLQPERPIDYISEKTYQAVLEWLSTAILNGSHVGVQLPKPAAVGSAPESLPYSGWLVYCVDESHGSYSAILHERGVFLSWDDASKTVERLNGLSLGFKYQMRSVQLFKPEEKK